MLVSHLHPSEKMKRSAAHVWTCLILTCFFYKTCGKIQDVHVTCQYSEDCVLPCSFTPSGREEIHWFKKDDLIYSHPQSPNWNTELSMGRTPALAGDVSLGNASLLLQRCVLTDRGRYRCQVRAGEKEDIFSIVLKVEAPIHSVNLKISRLSGYEEVKCSTNQVYPAPHVFWSTNPPTPMEKLKYVTRKIADKDGLYVIESKLKMLGRDLSYICTVKSSSAAQMWTVSLAKTDQNNITTLSPLYTFSSWREISSGEGQDITIPCRSPWTLQNFTLTWSFTRADMSTIICTYNSETQLITNLWNSTALLEPQGIERGDGSLRLLAAQSLNHVGTYTCNISSSQRNQVEQTRVNITPRTSQKDNIRTPSSKPWWIPLLVVIALIAIITATVVGIVKFQKKCSKTKSPGTAKYSKEVKVTVNQSEEITEGNGLTSEQNNEDI